MSNYHKTFFLHGLVHTEAVTLSDIRHEQPVNIPRTPISFKYFPHPYFPCSLFSFLFLVQNTLGAFFMTADWCEGWGGTVCLPVPMLLPTGLKENPSGLKEGGRFWHSEAMQSFWNMQVLAIERVT